MRKGEYKVDIQEKENIEGKETKDLHVIGFKYELSTKNLTDNIHVKIQL